MDIDNDPSGLIGSEESRFDTGIDQTPLSGPVVAHGAVAVDVPAFHPVRPVHLGMHCRQRPVDVVTAYQHRVFSVALRLLRNRTESEEVAQEVFLRVYRTVTAFRGDAKLST